MDHRWRAQADAVSDQRQAAAETAVLVFGHVELLERRGFKPRFRRGKPGA